MKKTTLLRSVASTALLGLLATVVTAAPTRHPELVRLGSNENPYGVSPAVRDALVKAIDSANYYNRDEIPELLAVLAEKEKVSQDYLYVTAGSGVVLDLIGMAYGAPGKNIINISPGYPQPSRAFIGAGGELKFAPHGKDMGYDFEALLKTIDANTKIVSICNPVNPTGALADPSALRAFLAKVPSNVLVVVDEAYLELADTPLMANSMVPMVKMFKNLVITRTFSKAYGLAGMRVGYAVGHPDNFARVKEIDVGSRPSYLAAIAAIAAIKDTAFMEANRKKYSDVRKYTMREFDKLGIKYNYPQGAFILFHMGVDSSEAQKKFREMSIMVARPTSFDLALGDEVKYKNWVRVSMGTQEDMEKFFEALRTILEKK